MGRRPGPNTAGHDIENTRWKHLRSKRFGEQIDFPVPELKNRPVL
jgi:hypothetical protein